MNSLQYGFFDELEKVSNRKPYLEGPSSTFTHNKREYSVDKAIQEASDTKVRNTPIRKLDWIFRYAKPAPRKKSFDLTVPVLATPWRGKLVVVDGLHRLNEAKKRGLKTIPTKILTSRQLYRARHSTR